MEKVRVALNEYNLDWNAPMVFIKNDEVHILTATLIFEKIELLKVSLRNKIYKYILSSIQSKKQMIKFIKDLGDKLLSIKL